MELYGGREKVAKAGALQPAGLGARRVLFSGVTYIIFLVLLIYDII